MKSMHLLLNEAERSWRYEVQRDFPIRGNTPVIKNTEPNGRDWTFSTDLQKIFAHIANDESLQKKFESVVPKYWQGTPEALARDTFHYLLFHELYHPVEAPFSVEGKDNDNKKIHQAIRRGVLQAEPKLSSLEQVLKVQASQNGVKDFILDNRFALDNGARKYVPQDIIPIWDVLELQNTPSKTNFYTVTRLLYGLMYGPESAHAFFQEKAGTKGMEVAEQALSKLLQSPVQLPKKKGLMRRAKSILSGAEDKVDSGKQYVPTVRAVFGSEDRYRGVERFMSLLGPYVEQGMPQGRPDMQGEGSGTSPQNILQDLLDDMNPQEQQEFVQGLNQEEQHALQEAANEMNPKGKNSSKGNPSSTDEMKNLDLLATHEFYKRNHPRVKIIGGRKVGESLVVGQKEYWALQRSTVLTQDDLSKVNLRNIDIMQRKTRLPWLMDLGNGTYRLNEYELKQKDLKDIVYRELDLDVPDAVELYLDSSGSMFGNTEGKFKVNDCGRWDMLSHVIYGFVDALHQAGHYVGKQSAMRIHNFANSQVESQLIPVDRFWQGDIDALRVLFKPENGYNVEDLDISNYRDNQKRAYVVVTDGELVIDGRSEREAGKMKNLAKSPNNTVALFEIGGTYSLGEAVKQDANIQYYQVHDKSEMLRAGLEVLLSK